MNLPLNLKINRRIRKDGKYLLKKLAERYLPEKVIYRPKAGFPATDARICAANRANF